MIVKDKYFPYYGTCNCNGACYFLSYGGKRKLFLVPQEKIFVEHKNSLLSCHDLISFLKGRGLHLLTKW